MTRSTVFSAFRRGFQAEANARTSSEALWRGLIVGIFAEKHADFCRKTPALSVENLPAFPQNAPDFAGQNDGKQCPPQRNNRFFVWNHHRKHPQKYFKEIPTTQKNCILSVCILRYVPSLLCLSCWISALLVSILTYIFGNQQ